MPGGYIPTLETKQRECWKFETRDVNSEFESRVSVQPSNIPTPLLFSWLVYLDSRRLHIPKTKTTISLKPTCTHGWTRNVVYGFVDILYSCISAPLSLFFSLGPLLVPRQTILSSILSLGPYFTSYFPWPRLNH